MDRIQQQLNYRQGGDYQIPVVHIAQLVGLALGLPKEKLAFEAHISGQPRFEKVMKHLKIK